MKNFSEILSIAVQSLRANKLRAFLTILGVVVGIFSIIVIMTIITMLQTSIEGGLSQLGKDTFQIQKFPAIQTGGPGSRAKYRNRKDITLEEFYELKDKLTQAKYVAAEQWNFGSVIRYGNEETNPNISVAGVTAEAQITNDWVVEEGRDLKNFDIQYSSRVCILGYDVVEKLFPNYSPIGFEVRVDGVPLRVVGVIEKQDALFGANRDSYIVMPITTFQSLFGKRLRSINITVMAEDNDSYAPTVDATIGYFRQIRGVPPGEENDFEIFSNESLITQVNSITEPIKIGALVVSIIALIAAGVGIMNIMLVSVTERTKEIGIRKAVGAKKSNILFQFLFEAIMLCVIGGLVGIGIGVGLGNLAGSLINATPAIPVDWVIIGIILCIVVGLVFGTYPAYKAANLDPIEALRYE